MIALRNDCWLGSTNAGTTQVITTTNVGTVVHVLVGLRVTRRLCRYLGHEIAQCLYVGDSHLDLRCLGEEKVRVRVRVRVRARASLRAWGGYATKGKQPAN